MQNQKEPEKVDTLFWDTIKECYANEGLPSSEPEWAAIKAVLFKDGFELCDQEGNTAMMVAVWSGKLEAALNLFEIGSNPSHKNARGLTVFQSMLRDINKPKFSPKSIADLLHKMSHTWSPPEVLPSGMRYASEHLVQWSKNFLLMPAKDIHSSILDELISYVAGPLSHSEMNTLTRDVASIANPQSVVNSSSWRSLLALRASNALAKMVVSHPDQKPNTPSERIKF